MLVRRILLCKRRPLRMWEFNPEGPRTIQHFFGMTPEWMYKLFFGPRIKCPDTTEDAGLSCNRLDTQVSNPIIEHLAYICHSIDLNTVRNQDWLSKAERIKCPAPLPEGSPGPAMARIPERTLSRVPPERAEGESGEAKSGPHALRIRTRGISASTEEENRGGDSEVSSPRGKKRAASEDLETGAPKQGKIISPKNPASKGVLSIQRPPTGQPSTEK